MPKRALEDKGHYDNILWLLIFDNVANALMRAAYTHADVTRCLCVCQTRGVRARARLCFIFAARPLRLRLATVKTCS